MSMLMMTGEVFNVLQTPVGTNKEGQQYGGDHQVQIMGDNPLTNGEVRKELVTLRTDHPEAFKKLVGKTVAVPIGAFVRNSSIIYYLQKGATPSVLTQPTPQTQV
jgi:hypothetical protein